MSITFLFKRVAIGAVLLARLATAQADSWTGATIVSSLQPVVNAEGGAIRVWVDTPVGVPSCGNTSGGSAATFLVFLFTNGIDAANSALVAGLYVALTQGTQVTFVVSSAGCSPWGEPVIVGMSLAP